MLLTLSYLATLIVLLISFSRADLAVMDVFTTAVVMSVVFIVSGVSFLRRRRRNYFLSFELFFFIVFFMVTYTFPLMAFNNEDLLLMVDIGAHQVNAALYLSTIGVLAYLTGASLLAYPYREELNDLKYDFERYDFSKIGYVFNRLTTVFVILFFLVDGSTFIYRYSNETEVVEGGLVLPYVRVFAIISTMMELSRLAASGVRSLKETIASVSVFYLLNMGMLMSFFLIIGYRSEFLVLALTVFLIYALLIKPVKKSVIILIVFVGFWVMALLKYFRGFNEVDMGELQSDGAFTLIGMLSEFYIPSHTLYEFILYVEANGPTMGTNALLHVLAFVPFLQSFVVRIFGLDVSSQEYLTSSDFISNYILGEDRSWGLGTHVIGDLYYMFGLPGIVVCMFIMGMIVSFLTERIIYRKQYGLIMMLFFIVITAQSFFFSRVEFFRPIRDLGLIFWVMIIARFSIGFIKRSTYEPSPEIENQDVKNH
jgi:oligosaccharide repeat unit polymerase